tara:strand:+ start:1644 stop:1943 length:300 start_codon:yes stop_codon:yes gene_type:complete
MAGGKSEVPSDFLPTKQVKLWKTNEKTKVGKSYSPRIPTFCTVVDPDTGKRCGIFMRNWDEMFYEKYGMCESCYLKYNSHVDELKNKIDNEVGEVKNKE